MQFHLSSVTSILRFCYFRIKNEQQQKKLNTSKNAYLCELRFEKNKKSPKLECAAYQLIIKLQSVSQQFSRVNLSFAFDCLNVKLSESNRTSPKSGRFGNVSIDVTTNSNNYF